MLDRVIDWAALLFSGIALFIALRVQRRQPELIAKQIAELDREVRERKEARVVAQFQQIGARYQIQVRNDGPAEARDVNLRFPDGDSPIPQQLVDRMLPIAVLQAAGSVDLVAAISHDCGPPFHVILSWHDGWGVQTHDVTLA